MSKLIRMSVLGLVASLLLGNSLACNTAEGMGKDTQRLGDKIEDAAD